MTTRRYYRLWAVGLSALLVALVLAALVAPSYFTRPTPDSLTFEPLSRAESAEDRSARNAIRLDLDNDLRNARLLARTGNATYLLFHDPVRGVCLVAALNASDLRTACRQVSELKNGGLWVEYGDSTTGDSFLAVAVPVEYGDARVDTDGKILSRTRGFVLVQTAGRRMTRFVLRSSKYSDLIVNAG